MKHLPAASYQVMPWKNGLGQTAEIARGFSRPSQHDFDWRVSVAQVKGPGAFSTFAGIDRTIVQLSGPPMTLQFTAEGREKTLTRLAPYGFPGEALIHAALAGPGTDFNVMVRRDELEQDVSCLILNAAEERSVERVAGCLLLYCVEGELVARSERQAVDVSTEDSVLLEDDSEERVTVVAGAAGATLLVARMKPRRRTAGA